MGTDIDMINNIFDIFVAGILAIFEFIFSVIFANSYFALIIYFVVINLLAIVLMKKDKEYAKIPNATRIKEWTLLMVAIVGGALGEYYAMFKYKHKTLHKKFSVGVPMIMMLHCAMISFEIFSNIVA